MNPLTLRGVIIPALAVFAAVTWWASRGTGDFTASEIAVANGVNSDAPASRSAWPETARGVGDSDERSTAAQAEAGTDTAAEAAFGKYVAGKYRFLETSEELRTALLARERIAVAINTAKQGSDAAARNAIPHRQAELEALDHKIGALLRPGDLAVFEVLKDSDIEQFQLDDYAGGVSAIAPVSDTDKKAILYTKLVHRQRFRQVLNQSGLMSGDLNASERRFAFTDVARALGDARAQYLQEVRQYLYNDEQFALLSNYETSEYNAELEKLRRIAYGEPPAPLTEHPE